MQQRDRAACAVFEDKWLEFLAESGFKSDDAGLTGAKPQLESALVFKVVTVRGTYLWLFSAALAVWAIQ